MFEPSVFAGFRLSYVNNKSPIKTRQRQQLAQSRLPVSNAHGAGYTKCSQSNRCRIGKCQMTAVPFMSVSKSGFALASFIDKHKKKKKKTEDAACER